MRISLVLCALLICALSACSSTPSGEGAQSTPRTQGLADASVSVLIDQGPSLEIIKPPERVRSVYPEPEQTKRAWARRMLLERRFSKELCAPNTYLLSCISAFRNPETRVLGRFSKRECMNAVDNIVGKELSAGGKSKGFTGAFYGDDLPAKLKAGREMDLVADRLGRKVLSVLLPAMRKHGARFVESPQCRALRSIAGRVDGN